MTSAVTVAKLAFCLLMISFSIFVFCRKSFCGYARVDVDLNQTRGDLDDEETNSEGKFAQLCVGPCGFVAVRIGPAVFPAGGVGCSVS